MYVNYCYYSATAGTSGSGVYQYLIPSVVTLNTNDIIFATSTSGYGTIVGNTTMKQVGSSNGMGKVYISCLLYTSPSPRDRQKSRMPSSA